MKIKSALLTMASGSIGGITGSHNRGGMYLKARRVPVNPNTSFQQAVRNNLSLLQTRFANTLTSAQRTAWATFAFNVPVTNAMGDTIKLTGQMWYVKANSLRLQSSLAPVDTAPVIFDLASLTQPVPTLTALGTTVSMAYTVTAGTDDWAREVGGALLIYASRSQNLTKNFFNGPYRFAGKVAGAVTPPTSPAVITLPFAAGSTGQKIYFRAISVRADGRPSPTLTFPGVVP